MTRRYVGERRRERQARRRISQGRMAVPKTRKAKR